VLAAVAALVALQYGALLSEGPSQLAVYQEAFRNSHNARPWRDRARLAAWLVENPPAQGRVLMQSGSLGPVVPASGLTFGRIVHEGTRAWNEWTAGGELPDGVATVIMEEGDPVWSRLREDPGFRARFALAYATGSGPTLEVWISHEGHEGHE
jgi:hypothetical protein